MATLNPIRLELDDRGLAPRRDAALSRVPAFQWSERLLIVFGIVCLAYFLYTNVEARLYQTFEDRELDKILSRSASDTSQAGRGTTTPLRVTQRAIPAGSVVGRIEIPRLGVSAVIRAGSDARTLRLAVGYIPGTALPGDDGNVGLAGHRDTFFRKLRDINPDDEIRVVTKEGVFRYYVQRTSIVMPDDVWVLDPTNYPALTLVTCYPFNYIGSAPKRFIVRALGKAEAPGPKLSIVRTAAATKVATRARVKSTVSKSPRFKGRPQPKRSTVRAERVAMKTTSRPASAKRARTAAKLRTRN